MARLFVQYLYLAIYSNENLPNSIKIAEVGTFIILSNINQANIRTAKDKLICQSEECPPNLVTLGHTRHLERMSLESAIGPQSKVYLVALVHARCDSTVFDLVIGRQSTPKSSIRQKLKLYSSGDYYKKIDKGFFAWIIRITKL